MSTSRSPAAKPVGRGGGTLLPLTLALLVIASAIAVVQVLGKQKYAAYRPLLVHSLRTGPARAEVMCHQNPHCTLEAIGAAIRGGALAYSADYATVSAATKAAYEPVAKSVLAHWDKVLKTVKTGLMLGGGGLVLGILTDTATIWQLLIGLACVVGGGLVFLYRLDVERSLVLARVEILPEVDQVFVERRYVYASAAS